MDLVKWKWDALLTEKRIENYFRLANKKRRHLKVKKIVIWLFSNI